MNEENDLNDVFFEWAKILTAAFAYLFLTSFLKMIYSTLLNKLNVELPKDEELTQEIRKSLTEDKSTHLVTCLIGPAFEELIFRAFMPVFINNSFNAKQPHNQDEDPYEALFKQNTFILAHLISAAIFGYMHTGNPSRRVFTAINGCLYSMLFLSFHSLKPSICAHALNNFVATYQAESRRPLLPTFERDTNNANQHCIGFFKNKGVQSIDNGSMSSKPSVKKIEPNL